MQCRKWLVTLTLVHLVSNVTAVQIRFIAIAIGNRRHQMSYEIAGAAFDTAIEHSKELYPKVFQNFSLTRYFVPGSFSCVGAAAEAITSLGTLYTDKQYFSAKPNAGDHDEKEFRIIISPGML